MILISLMCWGVSSPVHAEDVHGVFRVVKGDVRVQHGHAAPVRVRLGEDVFPSDVVITGRDSRAKIVMIDNNELTVSPDSRLEIKHYEYDPAAGKKDVLLNVIYGKVRAKVEQKYDGQSAKFEVRTPGAVAGVRGTDFLTSYDAKNHTSEVVTFRGQVEFGLPGNQGAILKSVFITPGKTSASVSGGVPSTPIVLPKSNLQTMDHESTALLGKSDGRQVASLSPGSGSTLRPEDLAGGDAHTMPPPGLGAPPPLAALPGKSPALQACDFCTQALQNGSAKVSIHVKSGN